MDFAADAQGAAGDAAPDRAASQRRAPATIADAIDGLDYSRPRDLPGLLGTMHPDRCCDPDEEYRRNPFRAVVRTKEICADLFQAFHAYADLGVNRYPLYTEAGLVRIGQAYIAEHVTRVWMFRESARRAGCLDNAEPIEPYTDAEVDHA
jgi:hypothetical protein